MMEVKRFFKGFKNGFEEFGYTITMVINSFLLSIVYLIGVGITSLIAKLVGKIFLDIELSKEDTYWSDLDLKKKSLENYYRQF